MFYRATSISPRFLVILGVSLVTLAMIACAGPPAASNAVDSGNTPTATSPTSEAVAPGDTPTATSPTSEAAAPGNTPTATSSTSEAAAPGDTPEPTSATVPEVPLEDISSASFSDPTSIDNRWFSLQPGRQVVIEGSTVEDGESLPHRIEFTVTGLIK
ncbi:MAG TPA: hypothetical protein VFR55_00050, partial [Dehalococcoidia bacterium]|nr:hypothetical protein [Dehalococcoidia bacterium]